MNRIFACIITAILLISVFSVNIGAVTEEEENSVLGAFISSFEGTASDKKSDYANPEAMLLDMEKVSENENYILYFHKETLAIGVADKVSGAVHFSNPYNSAADSNYVGSAAQRLDSQIILEYISNSSKTDTLFSSTDCVALGQHSVSFFENGVQVDFSIGEEFDQPLYPQVMSVGYFKKVISKLSAEDRETIIGYYIYTDIKEISDNNRKKWLRDTYPLIDNEPLYITPLDLYQREQHNLSAIFAKVGYTEEQFKKDSEKYNFELEVNKYPNFKLTLEYILTEDGLQVNIPFNSIKSSNDTFKLQSIQVLPFMLSENSTDEGGYIFVPDGSGAIIDINSDTEGPFIKTGTVYGEDQSNILGEDSNNNGQYFLPVYGIVKNNNSGIFAIIDSASEMSTITARLKAHGMSYSTVYNTFNYCSNIKIVKDTQKKSEGSAKTIYYYDKNPINTDFTVSYYFLTTENADYSGMARFYASKLEEKGFTKKSEINKPHLVLETVGAALYEDNFLGYKFDSEAKLTTYSQNSEIINFFSEQGIDNLSLVLSGWQKGGLDASLRNKIKLSSDLGGRVEFQKLIENLQKLSVPLYVQHNVMFVANDKSFDAFQKSQDTARCLDYSLSTFLSASYNEHSYKSGSFTVSPSKYNDLLGGFFGSCNANSVSGVDLLGFGRYLNSNFNKNKEKTNRIEAKDYIVDILSEYSKDINISLDGANAYVLPYVDHIRSLPMNARSTYDTAVTVPFLQMVLSGSVLYSSEPINLEYDYNDMLLQCIETGTSPAFSLIYSEGEMLKLSENSHLYDCVFETGKEWISESYKYVADALSVTEGSAFVRHEYLADYVTLSYFENGAVICVNKSSNDYEYNGITVPESNYAVINTPSNELLPLNTIEQSYDIESLWQESQDNHNEFYNSYSDLGKRYLNAGYYSEAMKCFEIISDDMAWEEAYKLYRTQWYTKYGYIFWPVVILILGIIAALVIFIFKYNKKQISKVTSESFLAEFLYGFYILLHPFKGFKNMKQEKRGSVRAATAWFALGSFCAVSSVLDASYFYENSDFTVLSTLANTLLPLLLWCISNMCFTTLMNGKGTLSEVYTAVGYATIPYTLLTIPCTLLSTVLLSSEFTHLSNISGFATACVLILIYIGMMKIHDYSFLKNLVVTVITVIGITFILFLIFVFAGLVYRMASTVVNMVYEIIYRL